jgi:regulator of extracellular matrix RemA (YlzA/DUF370 family)
MIGKKVYSIVNYEKEPSESIKARADFLGAVFDAEFGRSVLANLTKALKRS